MVLHFLELAILAMKVAKLKKQKIELKLQQYKGVLQRCLALKRYSKFLLLVLEKEFPGIQTATLQVRGP
jgi:hypothetical protein